MFVFSLLSALLIFADLLAKRLAVYYLASGGEFVLIPGALRLLYLENTGAAFGLLPDMRWLLLLVAAVVLLVVFWYIWTERCNSRWQYYGFIFIFAGALGNFLNRLFLGYVVDFINFAYFPVFNLADVFINIGTVLLIIYLFRQSGKKV
ncbi:MAG: signal peptidase II [Candidatus Margulisbacteria bacterium]|jgi:signal peptidase II|nr:signal peptidase II [Candidatus Margulisiibacteriota bacterium]